MYKNVWYSVLTLYRCRKNEIKNVIFDKNWWYSILINCRVYGLFMVCFDLICIHVVQYRKFDLDAKYGECDFDMIIYLLQLL